MVNSQINVSKKQRAYVGVASLKPYFDQAEIVIMLENLGGAQAKQIQIRANAYLKVTN